MLLKLLENVTMYIGRKKHLKSTLRVHSEHTQRDHSADHSKRPLKEISQKDHSGRPLRESTLIETTQNTTENTRANTRENTREGHIENTKKNTRENTKENTRENTKKHK